MYLLQDIQSVCFLIQTNICGHLYSKRKINIHSLYRIRTGFNDVEDLDGYLESNNAEDRRISTYIQCQWHKVKRSRFVEYLPRILVRMEQVLSASCLKSCIESTSITTTITHLKTLTSAISKNNFKTK